MELKVVKERKQVKEHNKCLVHSCQVLNKIVKNKEARVTNSYESELDGGEYKEVEIEKVEPCKDNKHRQKHR